MRILVCNKFWYRRGGLERVMFDEIRWLEEAGHEVAHFSTTHPKNDPSPWADYFVPYLELGQDGGLSVPQKFVAGARLFSNRVAARQFARLVKEFRPDIVHAHGIHRQISTSILAEAYRLGLPVVHSLHDYHLTCPADVLLYQGRTVCEPRRCGRVWFGPCVTGRCVRGNLLASGLSAAETAWSRALRRYSRTGMRFVCPSNFIRQQTLSAGYRVPMDVVANAVPIELDDPELEPLFLVAGRLSNEKGIGVAAEAARLANVPLVVAGDGPLRRSLESAYPEISFAGYVGADKMRMLTHRARAVVVPSLWYENASMSILESMAAGVPVIASRIGGIPEQITDGVDGLLVQPGDAEALSQAMRQLFDDRGLAKNLGGRARQTVAQRFSVDKHMDGLEMTYRKALARIE